MKVSKQLEAKGFSREKRDSLEAETEGKSCDSRKDRILAEYSKSLVVFIGENSIGVVNQAKNGRFEFAYHGDYDSTHSKG